MLDSVTRVRTVGTVAVVIDGEPGMGKSRLLAEVGAQLAGQGWRVLAVRADRLERQVPYGALGTAVQTLVPDNTFTQELRREVLAALALPPEGVPSPGAFGRACLAVTRLVTALTATGPLALLLDDLHELDDDSLALLAVVARRVTAAPVALVAAQRPYLAAPNVVAEELVERLADSAELVRVKLGTLTPAELAALVTPVLGVPPDAALTIELHDRTGGNPFFAAELARSLVDTGAVAVEAGAARLAVASATVPLTRRGTVLRRVLPLAPDAVAVARGLAVVRTADLGRLALVAEVTGLPEPVVATAFDDLLRARVVVENGAGRYRFFHDLVADALYDDIGPARCRQLHGMVAARMLAQRARGEPVDLLELAWHVSESAQPPDPVAVEVLTEAAHRAMSSAPEAAAGFCTRALALLPEDVADVDVADVADVADAPERATLLALQCRALARASRPADAVPPGRAALARTPPGEARAGTATVVLGCLFLLGRIADALEVADDLAGGGCRTLTGRRSDKLRGDVPATLRAQRALLLVFANRVKEAATEAAAAEAALAAAVPPASPAAAVVVYTQLAMVSSMLFRHDKMTELEVRTWRGELVLAERLARAPLPPTRNMASLHAWALGGYLATRGDHRGARSALAEASEQDTATYITLLLGRLAELEHECGRVEQAGRALARLVDAARPQASPWSRTTVHLVTGIVERDPDALLRTVSHAEEAELVFERARAQLALGELDPAAEPALVEAYQTFARLGAHGLRRKAGKRLHELGAKVPRARSRTPGLLTEAEVGQPAPGVLDEPRQGPCPLRQDRSGSPGHVHQRRAGRAAGILTEPDGQGCGGVRRRGSHGVVPHPGTLRCLAPHEPGRRKG